MINSAEFGTEERWLVRSNVNRLIAVLDVAEFALREREKHPVGNQTIAAPPVPPLSAVLHAISLVKDELEGVCMDLQPQGDLEWLRRNGYEV